MSKLVLTVRGGLGSRLHTLLAARIFARQVGADLEFVWPVEVNCGCPFELLFEDSGQPRGPADAAAPGLHLEDHAGQSNARIEQALAEGGDVYFTTFYANLRPAGMSAASFRQELIEETARLRPVAAVRARVRPLPPGMIGLQIRRQDHWRNTRYSPLSLFFRVIDRTLRQDPAATFYLCTDSARVGHLMRRRYGARVWQAEELGHCDSATGVQEALAEMLTVAQTDRLYRCACGCFADMVGLLSRRPTLYIRLRDAPSDYFSRASDQRHDELMHWDQKKLAWRGRKRSRSLRARLEAGRYRLLNRFVTSDFYQRWPFHTWDLKEVEVTREVAPVVAGPGPQLVLSRREPSGQDKV